MSCLEQMTEGGGVLMAEKLIQTISNSINLGMRMAAQLEDDEPVLVSDFNGGGSLGWWRSARRCEGRVRWERAESEAAWSR
jgi:hypothetical protein